MTEGSRPMADPVAMRALAHPVRLAILDRLRTEGSATATDVAEVVGVTPSAASYHLRMLAKYGFVEDAPPRGDGRERNWRRVQGELSVTQDPADTEDDQAAKDLLIRTWLKQADAERDRALAEYTTEPPDWRKAALFKSTLLLVDPDELIDLREQINALLEPYLIDTRDRDAAPTGARVVEAQLGLFPRAPRRPHGLPTTDHAT